MKVSSSTHSRLEARKKKFGNRNGKMIETGRSIKSKASFVGDAPRVWNKAPTQIMRAKSVAIAKKEIRKFGKSLPI